uniref:Uncharacterized protein n=1 Tax=Oryza nivara TaxID=4536 RepID=A0A0E0HTS7_ORYNI
MERKVFPWEKVQKHHDRKLKKFYHAKLLSTREHNSGVQVVNLYDLTSKSERRGAITVDPGAPRRTSSEPTAFPAPPPLRNSATSGGTAEGSSRAPNRASARDASARATSRCATSTITSGSVAPGAAADDARTALDVLPPSWVPAPRRRRRRGRRRGARVGKETAEDGELVAGGGERSWSIGSRRGVRRVDERSER